MARDHPAGGDEHAVGDPQPLRSRHSAKDAGHVVVDDLDLPAHASSVVPLEPAGMLRPFSALGRAEPGLIETAGSSSRLPSISPPTAAGLRPASPQPPLASASVPQRMADVPHLSAGFRQARRDSPAAPPASTDSPPVSGRARPESRQPRRRIRRELPEPCTARRYPALPGRPSARPGQRLAQGCRTSGFARAATLG